MITSPSYRFWTTPSRTDKIPAHSHILNVGDHWPAFSGGILGRGFQIRGLERQIKSLEREEQKVAKEIKTLAKDGARNQKSIRVSAGRSTPCQPRAELCIVLRYGRNGVAVIPVMTLGWICLSYSQPCRVFCKPAAARRGQFWFESVSEGFALS